MASSFVGRDMAVDLGTANTLVYVRGKGVVLDEPSVVAMNTTTGEVLAVGHEAKRMIGRTPDNIAAIRPLKDGVIADFEATEQMLRYFIQQVHRRRYFAKPRMVICVPSGITAVEQRAVKEAGYQAGARKVYIVEEPMAAAIGAGLPVHEATGNMIVDVGGGTTEVAVISLGGIVTSMSVRTAGDDLDQSIIAWMKKEYSLMLGDRTAEEMKITLGSAFPLPYRARGRDPRPRHGLGPAAHRRRVQRRAPAGARGAAPQHRRRRALDPRPDPSRARRRHHGPRHRAHRWRRPAPRPRRAAAPRDGHARARRRGPALERRVRRRQVRRGVRGPPAGARLGRTAILMAGFGGGGATGGRERRWRGMDRLDVAQPAAALAAGGAGPGQRHADHARLPRRHRLARRARPPSARRGLRPDRGRHGGGDPPVHRRSRRGSVPRAIARRRDPRPRGRELRPRGQVATAGYDKNRLEEYDGLTQSAESLGGALVPARVVAYGSSQSFSNTVTIDAGSQAGIGPDMTVINNDGLVGRVLRVTRTTATVLLIIDQESNVGGRVGLQPRDRLRQGPGLAGRRRARAASSSTTRCVPAKHDTVVTWGSSGGPVRDETSPSAGSPTSTPA